VPRKGKAGPAPYLATLVY